MAEHDERSKDPKATPHGLSQNPFAALRAKLGDLPPGPAVNARDADANPTADARKKNYTGRVTVRRERSGRGGKAVTLAEGPGLSGHPLEILAKDLAKALGAGARVENNALLVQGDQPDRVVAWLNERGFVSVARGN